MAAIEKENAEAFLRHRSKSPVEVAAESRFMMDQQRHMQYINRYTVPVPEPIMMKAVISQHQEYFVNGLQNEVNELKSRQKDYAALQD